MGSGVWCCYANEPLECLLGSLGERFDGDPLSQGIQAGDETPVGTGCAPLVGVVMAQLPIRGALREE